jgi:hypothetical protein
MESGVGGKTYDIIKSTYTNNKCAVKIGKKHTYFFPQGRGVRQGCSLSPTLFNIYIYITYTYNIYIKPHPTRI